MTDFTPSNTTLRSRPTYSLVAAGNTINLIGGSGAFHLAAEVLGNAKHYKRTDAVFMGAISADDVAGYICATMDGGSRGTIIVTKAEYAAAAAERDAYAVWLADFNAKRAFFDGVNENGEGFNPYR